VNTALSRAIRSESAAHRALLVDPHSADRHAAWVATDREVKRIFRTTRSPLVVAEPPTVALLIATSLAAVALGLLVALHYGMGG
jgi:hypothetical protein